MSAPGVSVVVPARQGIQPSLDALERYLESTGLTFEVLSPRGDEGDGIGAVLRRGVSEAKGRVIVIADPQFPYPLQAIGDVVAMVESGAADVVFGAGREEYRGHPLVRGWLAGALPDPFVPLSAFSSSAGKTVYGESRLRGAACAFEVAFLANKYGFRVEYLVVHGYREGARPVSLGSALRATIAIRMANRRQAYRAARRCPVCFSNEVFTCAQIPGNVVRSCRRCKCRYLNQFTGEEGTHPVRRVLRPHPTPSQPTYESHSPPARERTSLRRLQWVRRQVPARSRVLEVGVRDGTFGSLASNDYEYVGIDPASAAARQAQARGLEVYCCSLSSFVNVGPAFDAITLFHVFENLADPHDALGRIKELLKPGGVLFLSTFDTEGLIYLFSERKRMAQNFRTRLILYSRSALIELFEQSGFEIIDIGPDFEHRDHKFLRHWMTSHHPLLARLLPVVLRLLPDPLLISTGSIRIMARRRSGGAASARALRSVEPTHAR